jgi:catechol 2,3-dioxygenase-like lactoylglutathione lyase family enzyme
MIDHVGIEVSNYKKSKESYKRASEPLGYELIMEVHGWAEFGVDGKPDFWIHEGINTKPMIHVAFRSKNREKVMRFHEVPSKQAVWITVSPA